MSSESKTWIPVHYATWSSGSLTVWPTQVPASEEQDPTYGLPAVLTVEETAEFLRLNPKTVHAAINAGEIPARKVRKRTLVFREALLKWLRSKPRVSTRRKRNR